MTVAKRSFIALAVTILFLAGITTIITDATDNVDNNVREFHVYPSSGTRAPSIQSAIIAANHGDVIIVHEGTYNEKLDVYKGVTIRGAPGENMPRITATAGTSGPFGHVRLSLCTITSVQPTNPVVLDGLEFYYEEDNDWDYGAVKIQAGDDHEIRNCVINGSYVGIWVHSGDIPPEGQTEFQESIKNVKIHHNTITNIEGHGIYLQKSMGEVYQNKISNSRDGIVVALGWTGIEAEDGNLSDNKIDNCSIGINLINSNPLDYKNNRIEDSDIGEIINHTQQDFGSTPTDITQTSEGNIFINCRIGSSLNQTTTTRLIDNVYEDCNISISANNSFVLVDHAVINDTKEFSIDANGTYMIIDGLSAIGGNSSIRFSQMKTSPEDHSPTTIDNSMIDGEGDYGIMIDRCSKIAIQRSEFNGFLDPILPVWESSNISQLDHDIPQTNTADGGPIFYTFGDDGALESLTGAGQIIIAKSQNSRYRFTEPQSRLARILHSTDMDLQDSEISEGLLVWESENIEGNGMSIVYSNRIESALKLYEENLQKTTVSLYNSNIDAGTEEHTAINMDRRSILDLYSTDVVGENQFEGPSSEIHYHSSIGMEVFYQEGIEPVEGADYKVMSGANEIHSTSLFGGTDALTDVDGSAGPFWALYRTEKQNSDNDHTFRITVNVTADLSWEEERTIDATTDHDETFITLDIRKPATPENFRGIAVSNDDANRLEWDLNQDDTEFYRLYYLDETEWTILSEEEFASFDHSGAPNGTLAYYKLTAVDEVGLESPFTSEVEVLTTDMVGPTPPRDLRVFNITDSSLSLSWKTSLSLDVEYYEVFSVEADMTRATGIVTAAIRSFGTTTDPFMDLVVDLSEENAFAVRAVDEAGNPSEFSNPVSLEANDLTWPTISNIEWIYGASSARITWETDEPTTSTVWSGSAIDDFGSYGPTELGTSHMMEIKDLDPETTYYFYIFAVEPSGNDVTDNNEGLFYTFTTFGSEGFIRITVLDQDNEPATGIKVTAVSESDQEIMIVETTAGNYEAILIPGNWTISVVSEDHSPYAPFNTTIEDNTWFNTTVQLTSILWEKANLTIIVVDESGNTVIGATILVDSIEYTTGPGGIAYLGEVDTDATYLITVTAPGFEEFSKSIFVPAKGKDQSETIAIIHQEEPAANDDFMMWVIILIIAVVLLLLILIIVLIFLKKRSRSEPEEKEEEKDDKKEETGPEPEVKKGAIGGKAKAGSSTKLKGKKGSKELKPKDPPVEEGNILTPAEAGNSLPPANVDPKTEEVKEGELKPEDPKEEPKEEAPAVEEPAKKEDPPAEEVKKAESPKEPVKEEAPPVEDKIEQPPQPEAPKPETEYIKPQK